jgi:hypothetical protein
MKVTLSGPDDLGRWVLHSEFGDAFPLVERHEDHPAAAALFGWTAPKGVTDEEEIIQDALDWLNDHINGEIEAPADAVQFFRELEGDDEDDKEE